MVLRLRLSSPASEAQALRRSGSGRSWLRQRFSGVVVVVVAVLVVVVVVVAVRPL